MADHPVTPDTTPAPIPYSTLVQGVTGSGKSTLLATEAEYLYETYGRITHLYLSDLGGIPSRVENLIAMGLVRIFRLRTRGDDRAFETANLASKGYWPSRIKDKFTGEVEYGVRMVPPVTTIYTQFCNHCGAKAKETQYERLLATGTCPSCAKPLMRRDTRVEVSRKVTRGFERHGHNQYDGLTSLTEWFMANLTHQDGLGETASIKSGDAVFGTNHKGHFGFAQVRTHELVSNSLAVPNLVKLPTWTALTAEATDASGLLTLVGPKLAGQAQIEIAGAWFGNTLEAATVQGSDPTKKIRRLYLSEYYDDQNRRHLLKHRYDPRFMPEYIEDPEYTVNEAPEGLCTGFSLRRFYQLAIDAVHRGQAELASQYPHVPGIEATPSEFGEAAEEPAPAPVAAKPTVSTSTARPAVRPRAKVTPAARSSAPAPAAAPAPTVAEAPAAAEPTLPLETQEAQAVQEPPAPQEAPPVADAASTPVEAAPAPTSVPASAPSSKWAPPAGTRPPRVPAPAPRRPVAAPRS